jgi:hypothetical protein
MAEQLLETLETAQKAGKDTDSGGFKPEVWVEVTTNVNKAWKGDGMVTEESCRNKWQWFKDHRKLWKILAGMSGFGWDEEQELYKADKEVWDNLAKSYRNIKWYKNNVLHWRDILSDILDHAQATGAGAFATQQDELATAIEDDTYNNIDPSLIALDNATTTHAPAPQPQGLQTQLVVHSNTPRLSYSKSKSRLRSNSDDDGLKKPRKKVELAQAIVTLAESIERDRERKERRDALKEEHDMATERAIDNLYTEYEHRMEDDAFIQALN